MAVKCGSKTENVNLKSNEMNGNGWSLVQDECAGAAESMAENETGLKCGREPDPAGVAARIGAAL